MNPVRPQRGLIDTDVLRACRRGEAPALQFLDPQAWVVRPATSQLSAITLIADAPDTTERVGLGMFLSWFIVHALTAQISRRAAQLLDSLPPPCGLTADDAIVAATALAHKLPLYTLDPARFAAVPGLTAIRPY